MKNLEDVPFQSVKRGVQLGHAAYIEKREEGEWTKKPWQKKPLQRKRTRMCHIPISG